MLASPFPFLGFASQKTKNKPGTSVLSSRLRIPHCHFCRTLVAKTRAKVCPVWREQGTDHTNQWKECQRICRYILRLPGDILTSLMWLKRIHVRWKLLKTIQRSRKDFRSYVLLEFTFLCYLWTSSRMYKSINKYVSECVEKFWLVRYTIWMQIFLNTLPRALLSLPTH